MKRHVLRPRAAIIFAKLTCGFIEATNEPKIRPSVHRILASEHEIAAFQLAYSTILIYSLYVYNTGERIIHDFTNQQLWDQGRGLPELIAVAT